MVSREELAPYVEEISRALSGKGLEKSAIEKEMADYIETYKVNVSIAMRSLVKRHGGDVNALGGPGMQKSLSALEAGDNSVELLVRVVTVNPREILQNGEKRVIHYGFISDATGTRKYTAWMEAVPFEKGDVIRVKNGYTKEFRNEVEVHFGQRAVFRQEPKGLAPSLMPTAGPGEERRLGDLREGGVATCTVRILSKEKKEISMADGTKTVHTGTVADESGKAQYTMWKEFPAKVGDAVKISGAFVKRWKGIPQLSIDERSSVEKVSDRSLPPLSALAEERLVFVEELERLGGGSGIKVRGVVIDIKEGSGLVFRCPQENCRMVLQGGECRNHGKVEGVPDLRVKAVVDDGTGALMAVLSRDLTEALLGKKLEACLSLAKEKMDTGVIRESLIDLLLARPVEISGNAMSDEFGFMLIGKGAKVLDLDPKALAAETLEELGEEAN